MHPYLPRLLIHGLHYKILTPIATTDSVCVKIAWEVVLGVRVSLAAVVLELVEPPGLVINIGMQQQLFGSIYQAEPAISAVFAELIL